MEIEIFNTLIVYATETEPNKVIAAIKSIKVIHWIALGLIVVAGAANGVINRISFHYYTVPESWNELF